LARFCEITGRNLQEMNTRLLRDTERSRNYLMSADIDAATFCNQPKAKLLTPVQREKIRAALANHGSITEFCTQAANRGFSSVYISRVLNGRTKSITPKVEKLAAALAVDLTPTKTQDE
jgi:hypothetical protein